MPSTRPPSIGSWGGPVISPERLGTTRIIHIQPVYCNRFVRWGYTEPMDGDGQELSYYRSVEDLFASLRGTPHVLSPRDFQLLRSWWRDGIPLAAVASGLTEVFTRNREREDANPVVSLSYCRHAVKRNAKRLAEMRTGQSEAAPGKTMSETAADCVSLVSTLRNAANAQRKDRAPVAEVLSRIAAQIETACSDLAAAMLDEHLFSLEAEMLHQCWAALSEDEQTTIGAHVESAVASTFATEEARQRSTRALRDRELRLLLDLPRLDVG